jgi:hypothetical protein
MPLYIILYMSIAITLLKYTYSDRLYLKYIMDLFNGKHQDPISYHYQYTLQQNKMGFL